MRAKSQRFDPRQSMNNRKFEVFHYKDPNPSDGEMHHHDFYEVCCFLGGEVEYLVDGRIYHLNPGDILLINPMELHRHVLRTEGTLYERIVLWINVEYLKSLSTDSIKLTNCFDGSLPTHNNILRPNAVHRAEIISLLGELVRENYSDDYGADLSAHGIFVHFMTELNRLALSSKKHREYGESSDLVARVLSYIGENYNKEISLEQLSQNFYVSKYHLSHEFSREVGISVYRYIMLKRLVIARQLLQDGVTPNETCVQSGFGDYTSFYRAFKTEYGINPRAYATKENT